MSSLLKLGETIMENVGKFGNAVTVESKGLSPVTYNIDDVLFGPRDTSLSFEVNNSVVSPFPTSPDTQFEVVDNRISFVTTEGTAVKLVWYNK